MTAEELINEAIVKKHCFEVSTGKEPTHIIMNMNSVRLLRSDYIRAFGKEYGINIKMMLGCRVIETLDIDENEILFTIKLPSP